MAIKICIDAGHGNNANKGVCSGYYESNGNFALANIVSEELEKSGFVVVKTKNSITEDPSLEQRGNMAKGCDLFLSLHSDAASNQSISYVTAIRSIKRPKSYTLGAFLAGNIENLMKKDIPNITLSKYSGSKNGVWTRLYPNTKDVDYYSVIRNAAKYSECKDIFLLECGHHTNQKTCEWLDNSIKRKELALVIVNTIKEYYNVQTPAQGIDTGTFVKNITPLALDIQKRYNLLASLSLSQAILNTNYNPAVGDSSLNKLSTATNNLFKITKDISTIKGGSYIITEDGMDTDYTKYTSMKECFEDYAKIITTNSEYQSIKNATNLNQGAIAAQDDGWTSEENYAQKLIEISDNLNLTQYDDVNTEIPEIPTAPLTDLELLEKRVETLENKIQSIILKNDLLQ